MIALIPIFVLLSPPTWSRHRTEISTLKRFIAPTIGTVNQIQDHVMIFSPVQCRMARAALGLGIRELALAAKVSIDTITRFERGDQLKERTIEAIQRALEAAGVEFTNGDQPGVRLAKTSPLEDSGTPPSQKGQKGSKAKA
jgi:hypothetical protein